MKLLNILISLVSIYIFLVILVYFLQDQFIFQGEELDPDHQFNFETPFEEIDLVMEDGANINLLIFRANQPKGLMVYYHGNAGNLEGWGHVVEYFASLGYDVAVMDYRGYGKSTGKRNQKTLLSDALKVYNYFKHEYSEESIVIYGRSLGTGIASYVASQTNPGKLILETPYYSFVTLAKSSMPIFPVGLLLKYRFPTYKYLLDVDCPVIVFHGTEDMIVPFKQGVRLFENLDQDKATMFVIDGGSHNNLIDFEEFRKGMMQVLE